MEKYIFLDFDGVITTEKSRYKLDKDACDLLGEIINATDAKIVVSSSWRCHTLEETKEDLVRIRGFVPFPFPYVDRIVGITERAYRYFNSQCKFKYGIPRGVEIKWWLDENAQGDYTYVILDDDGDMLLEQKDNFIQTDPYKGINKEDVKLAIKILNKYDKKH